jgi:DNA-binding CsgD family transcriptional regulator
MEKINEFILSLYRESRTATPDEFFQFAFNSLKKSLWFESGVAASAMTDHGNFSYRTCQLWNQPIEKILDYNKEIGRQDTVAIAMIKNPGKVITAVFKEDVKESDEFLIDYSRRYDIGHTMCVQAKFPGTTLSNGMALWRGQHSKAYSDSEKQRAQLILPHLLQSLAFNLADTVKNSDVKSDNGVVIACWDGSIITIDARARELVSEEWREWNPPKLPPQLLDKAMARGDRRYLGERILATVTPQNTFLVIKLQRKQCMETLREASLATSCPAERMALRYGLSKAERQLLGALLDGLVLKQYAQARCISYETARSHLYRIFSKTGCKRQAELVARSFEAGV